MILNYDIFYRRFGVRRVNQMLAPVFGEMQAFQLPRGALLHYAHGDATKLGPAENDIAFRGIVAAVQAGQSATARALARPVQMYHIGQLIDPIGKPIKMNVVALNLVRDYHRQCRRFRRVNQLEQVLHDNKSLVVYNYELLPHLFRYPRTFFNQYYEWTNIERTMWDTIATSVSQTDRQHFVMRNMPRLLPARSSFLLGEKMKMDNPSRRILAMFNSPESLFLLELWKWFGPERHASLLDVIPREKLRFVNLVIQESGRWLTLNLGLIDSWRKPADDEHYEGEEILPNLIDPDRFQRRALRFFMAIHQLRSVANPEVSELAELDLDVDDKIAMTKELNATAPGAADPTMKVTKVADVAAVRDPVTGIIQVPSNTIEVDDIPITVDEPEDRPIDVKTDALTEAKIDADLAELENIGSLLVDLGLDHEDADDHDVSDLVDDHHGIAIVPFGKRKEQAMPELKTYELDEAIMNVCNRFAENGNMSGAELRKFQTISKAYKTMKSPDPSMTMEEFIKIPPETLTIKKSAEIADISTVPDKTMLKSSLLEFDQRYITEVMARDTASMVLHLQNAGVAITSYEVERHDNIMGSFDMFAVRVVPVEGTATTLRFKLPVVEEDGSYVANGVKYYMRKQRNDLPIRKIREDTVALTSYYGKVFVRRSEKKVNNYATWLLNSIMAKNLNPHDVSIQNGHNGDVFDNTFKCPRLYSIMASAWRSFTLQPQSLPAEHEHVSFEIMLDHRKREEVYGKETLALYEVNGAIILGAGGDYKDRYLLIGRHGTMGLGYQGKIVQLEPIEVLLGLDRFKAPVDFAVMKVMGEAVPLGVLLAYEVGLDGLIALLGAKIRRVPAGRRLNLELNEESIVFNDETIVIDKNDHLSCMFLAGFNEFHRVIKRYNVHLFNKRDVYLNVLEGAGMNVRHLREIDLFYQMFIDPITRDLLIEMKEPTDMRRLLLRAGALLINDDHPDELDAAFMRVRGYERMPGAVYSELIRTLRAHNGRPGKARSGLEMSPYDIWTNIQTDPSKAQVVDINPIQNLKEKESVTYSGVGGRNSRTMTKHTRVYHKNDMGTISSDTVDSSDVAINTYTSADPQFTSLRGISRRYDDDMGATALLSTAALISVGSDRDDPKRVNFVGIQHSHGVACNGYRQASVRTGYEQVVAQRTSDMYAAAALFDGKVVAVTKNGVQVEYDDGTPGGTRKGYEIGRRYGDAAGLVIPHTVVSNVKVGQVFKKGEILTYNTGFFEKDVLNPKNVVWKIGVLVKTALMELNETLEDSSAISQRVADMLVTPVTKIIPIVVNFDQQVHRLVKIGDSVNSEDILCIIQDAVTSNAGLFDEESLDTLRILSNQTPQAKTKGVIERIEVFYHGDIEDMSDSLRVIAEAADRDLAARRKSIGKKVLTGSVDEGFRIEGDPLSLDSLAIRIYITGDVEAGEADKGVFANQMKTVFGKKFKGEYKTQTGERIDAIFGQKSIDDRIVNSPPIIGTTNVLLRLITELACKAYRS